MDDTNLEYVMERRQLFFKQVVSANLTGEQSRVLMRLLSCELDGDMIIRQNVLAEDLQMTESNVSRSIKALLDAGLIFRSDMKSRDNIPVFRLKKVKEGTSMQLLEETETAEASLFNAHVLFLKELQIVHSSLAIYKIVGINAKRIKGIGAESLHFYSLISQRALVHGLENVFERKNDGAGLCSVRGLLSLAQNVNLKQPKAVDRFTEKYGIAPTADWRADVEKVLETQRAAIGACLKYTSKLRNQRMAHLAQPNVNAEPPLLPSIGTCEQVIEFAHDFYVFIASAFLDSNGAELRDSIAHSFHHLLTERFGISNALFDFPES